MSDDEADESPRKKKSKGKAIGGGRDRTFRRLDERAGPTAPLPVAWAFGLGLGALAGLAAMAFDVAILERARIPVLPVLDQEHLLPWGVAHAALGAALGLLGGATGLFGPRWGTSAACATIGWVASPIGIGVATSAGLPGLVGLGVSLLLGAAAGQLIGRLPFPTLVHAGVSTAVLGAVVLLVPVHVHLLSSSSTAGAIGVSLAAGLLVLPYAVASALGARDGRPPIVAILGLLSIGSGLAIAMRTAAPPAPPATPAAGPTIVFVAVDGLRADDPPSMPNLAKLAKRSVVFEHAWTTSNWGVPALASALTGRWPYTHLAGVHSGTRPSGRPLDPRIATVADTLGRRGFSTHGVVADPGLRTYGLDAGFRSWEDQPPTGAPPAFALPLRLCGLVPPQFATRTGAGVITDRALAAVQQDPGRSAFVLVHYGDLTRPTPRPAALDDELGRLIAGVPDDAWLFLFGTHGRRDNEQRPGVEGAFGDGVFDDLVHVPLMVRAPRVGGKKVPRVVSVVDLPATVAEIVRAAGLGAPAEVEAGDGFLLAEVFGAEGVTERMVRAQSSGGAVEHQMIVSWPYKLTRTGSERVLYDIERDPLENDPLRIDPTLDPIERRLSTTLPSDGAPVVHGEGPAAMLQVGQLMTRLWGSGR